MNNNFENPVFVTGLPRTGTSMTAGSLASLGLFAGDTILGDAQNPKGYFENLFIRENIIKVLLNKLGACPLGIKKFPLTNSHKRLQLEKGFLQKALNLVLEQQGFQGETRWMLKDAKLTLLWEIFSEQFPNAIWIVVRRNRHSFINSCLKTSFMRQHSEKESFWNNVAEHYDQRLRALIVSVSTSFEVDTDQLVSGNYESIASICDHVGLTFSKDKLDSFICPSLWTNNKGA